MNNPVRILLLGFVAIIALGVQASAALVLNETFSYPDGVLTNVSSGVWSNHSGVLGQVDVASGKVNLSQAETEDVNTLLNGGPYSSGNLYASFVVNFSALPGGNGTYFAHFKETGVQIFKARVFATVTNVTAGMFRIGIANNSAVAAFIPRDLSLNTDYLIVVRYDTGATIPATIWINPGSEATTVDRADATDSNTSTAMVAFALRQSGTSPGIGTLTLDDLKVGTAFGDVTVPPVPPTIATQPANQIVCAGATANFSVTASGASPFTYQWYFNESNAITDKTNASLSIPNAQAANAGGYSVVVSNIAGSVTSVVASLTVNALPTVTVNSETICVGSSATLTATTAAASPAFLWSPGGATTASITVLPGSTTIYNCTVTDGVTGCSASGSGTVTVNPLPTVSVNSASVCDGGSAILTATTSAANPSYLWSPGGATTASITVSPLVMTIYTCLVTDGVTGCTNSGSGTVSVGVLPTVSVNSPTICPGGTATLTATTSAGSPTYLWSPGGATTASIMVSPAMTTIYTVTVTDATSGCANMGSGTVTVSALPSVTVNSTNVCVGGYATLTASTSAANPTYLWSPGGATTASITVNPGTTTVYTVAVTDGTTGCSANGSGTVTVNPLPVVSVNSAIVCAGDSTVVTATTSAANPTYSWSPGGATTASILVSPTATTTYAVTVTDGVTGCSASASGTVTVKAPDQFANTASITLNDNAAATPYPSVINVSGLTARVCRVTVTLSNLTHAFPDDIDMILVGPNGQGVFLMSDVGGGSGIAGTTLTFDDSAASSLPNGGPIVSGTFKPTNIGGKEDNLQDLFPAPAPVQRYTTNLATFSGINPNGAWSLYVTDDELVDSGTMSGGWSLAITTLEPFADVAVLQAASPAPVGVASNLTFTITVTNRGPAYASAVTLSDTLPANATFVSASSTAGACGQVAGVLSCAFGNLAPNSAAIVTLVVSPNGVGSVINSPTAASSTLDFVTANNSVSSTITVLNPPMITVAPTNSVICAGGSAAFAVAATGEPPLSYQWLLNGSPISGATSPTLNIANGQAADAGTYTVIVANVVGAARPSATLTVNPLPIVSVNSATNCVGGSSILTATHNAANPIFLWSPGGAMTASITVSPASTTVYSVMITDGVTGCSSMASGTVTVTPLTAATPIQSYTNVCPGSSITFNTVASGTPPFTYVWRKDGNAIAGQTTDTLTLPSVLLADAGTYRVEVTGTCGSVTNSGTLTVVAPPNITVQPQNQTTPMGNGAVFSVTASSVVASNIQWQLNGADIPGATANSLAVSNVTLAQNGSAYRAIVSNCGGSVTSALAVLTVTPVSGISFDFNTPGQYTNAPYYLTYNNWINGGFLNGTPAPTVYESPIGGVGPFPGGGGLDMSPNQGNESTSILLPVNFDFSLTGKTIYASTMFKVKTPITAGRRATQFGLVTATNSGINDVAGQGFTTVIVQDPTAGTPSYELRTQRRTTGGGLQESVMVAATPLTVSNWYKLNVTFLNTKSASSPSNYTIIASLQDMGPLGNTPGATNASFTTTTNNADIVNFKNVYLALRSFEDGGMEARDNMYAWTTPGNIFFVQAPQSQTVTQGNRVVFNALVDGEGPYTYQWSKNGSPIPGAGSWNYITPPVTTADNGAQYTVQVIGPANTITSGPATLSVTPQTLAVVSAGSVDGTTVGVLFNQPVQQASAENVANYTINGANPSKARIYRSSLGALGPEGIYVVLTPASVVAGSFNVVVSGVRDLSGGAVGVANSASGTVAGLTGFDVNLAITGPPGENYSFGPGQFIVSGGGPDIAGVADGFRFVYTTRTGDFDIKARVPYMDTIRFVSKAGFDARISLDPFSPMVVASFNPGPMAEGSGTLRQFTEGNVRNTWNVGTVGWGNNIRLFHPDVWLRLRRAGNTFIRYSSTNGVNWVFDGQTSPSTIFPPTIYVGLAVSAVRNLFAESAQFENYGEFAGYPGAAIAITAQPTNFTVAAGSSFTDGLIATVSGGGVPAGAGELTYVWQRNDGSGTFTNLATAGATTNTIAIGPLFGSDNGAQFRAIVRAPGATEVISATFTATVTDTAAPTLTSANGAILPSYQASEVSLTFSENVSAATATDVANYTVTNAAGVRLTVLSATFLSGDPRSILLKVDGLLGSGTSSVGITGVRDQNNNAIANTVRSFRSFLPSTAPVVVEVYQDVGAGTTIPDLTGNALYTGGTPTFICYSNTFGFNVGLGGIQDNYGVKIYTYFVPPTNGNYKFWIRTDDAGQLFMNTSGTNPAGKVLIAENTAFNATYSVGTTPATSVTNIALVGGQSYYLEMLGKEGTGGDGFSVMWTDPTVNTPPAATVFMPTTALAYPTVAAPSTPVVMDVFTGYQNFLAGFNQLAGLTAATNFPIDNYAISVVNFKYIAGVPDVIGYQKYFGVQPGTLGNTRLDNYLGRIQSYFIAPSNGLYRFWMGVDDVAQLYMNTNGPAASIPSTDPAGMVFLGQSANAFVSTASQLVAQNVPLIGGQKYYLMALWREGGGGDGIRIAVRPQSDGATPPTTEIIPASMLEYPLAAGRAGMVNFTGIVPANPMVPDGQSITLCAAGITGAPLNAAGSVNGAPYGYFWLKNGVRVLENSFTNITQPLTMADNGAIYTLVVSNWFSRAERSVTITVLPDNTAPTVVNSVGWRYGDGFNIVFSEPLNAASATFLGNYQISGGLTILSATLDPSGKMVSFRTTPQAAGTSYTITINGVKDASSSANTIAANTMTSFSTWTIGGSGFLVELYTNIPNSTVSDLTGQPKFVNNQPDVVYYTNVFGVGLFNANSTLENYGARISGYFIPTATSFYRFYVRSDDASQFWMNINATDSENPAGRTMLVHMPNPNVNVNDARAISQPVPLNAGQRYYVEALMKEGGGGDYLQVIFRQTDAAGTSLTGSPVDNTAAENSTIAMFGGSGVPGNPDAIQILQTPAATLTVGESDPVSLSLVAAVPSRIALATSYQWQKFSGATYTNIPGATGASLNFFATLADNNAQYRIVFSAPGRSASYVTLLHVTNDITAPYMVSANSLDGRTIGICYNERIDPAAGGDNFNYTINGGSVLVGTGVVRPDGRTVVLTLDTPISGLFTVESTNIADLSQAMNLGGNIVTGRVQNFFPLDVGAPTAVGSSFSCLESEIDVVAGGNDIWGNSDVGQLTLSPRSGDFDIHARIQSLTPADPAQPSISKAGLMIRQTLDANSTTIYHSVNPPPPRGRDQGEVGQRSTVGGATALFAGSAAYIPVGIPNAWLRAQRRGNTFTFFRSSDGLNWIQVASGSDAFSNQVFIGLATTAHTATQVPGLTTLAEYRDVYIPNPPTILIPPAPASQTVAINSTVNYSVTASNPPNSGPLTYQWLRNGLVIPNETNRTLTLANLAVADSGLYSVNAGNDGGATVSASASLTVSNALPMLGADSISTTQGMTVTVSGASLLGNDSDPEGAMLSVLGANGVCSSLIAANFDRGLPPNSTAYVNAFVDSTGGVGNSGVLKLTLPAGNQGGVFYTSDLSGGAPVVGFRASFKVLVSQGSGNPADGFSLSFANDLPNPPASGNPGEEGAGNGLIVAFDNYDNGGAEAPAIDVKWAGTVIANGHVSIPKIQSASYLDVVIQLDPDGTLDVMFGGNIIYNNLPTPYVPISGGRFALGARTGGEFETHWIDDLNISVINRTPRGGLVFFDSGTGNITYTPGNNPCGTDSFVYLASDGQEGGVVCGTVNVNITVTNATPLIITTQPENRTNNIGTTATFSVLASGEPPLSYQWLKGGAPLSGQTGTTLTLSNVQTADAGGYRAVATDLCGASVTSVVATLTINLPPIARNDGYGTPRNTALNIPVASLLANDSDPEGGTLTVTGVSASSRAGGTVGFVAGVVIYTPPANFLAGDTFSYAISDGQGGTASAVVCVVVSDANLTYPAPIGGWAYVYKGDAAAGMPRRTPAPALDGTWRHENGSDEWNGDGRGAGNGPAGGIETSNGILTIEDAVTTGSGNNNNRKIYFTHDVRQEGISSTSLLDSGVTLSFRARLTPSDTKSEITMPNGWGIFSDGKGNFGIRQSSPSAIISFSLVQASNDFQPSGTPLTLEYPMAGLLMNKLNGDAPGTAVDANETGGVTNLLALDPTVFHEFWIGIQANDTTPGNGTHTVRIYTDGSTNASVFNVTAGNGSDPDTSVTPNWNDYIALGCNNSPTVGAFDTDFFAYKAGVVAPGTFTDPEHPQLRIVRQGNGVVISWSQTCGPFVLEQTGSLTAPIAWSAVGAPVIAVGSNYQVTVTASGNQFFRLRQP